MSTVTMSVDHQVMSNELASKLLDEWSPYGETIQLICDSDQTLQAIEGGSFGPAFGALPGYGADGAVVAGTEGHGRVGREAAGEHPDEFKLVHEAGTVAWGAAARVVSSTRNTTRAMSAFLVICPPHVSETAESLMTCLLG